jgi:60 kDa SS-A/Ro ribonucleoprotein
MANAYSKHIATPTPQSKPLDETQVKNNAGGYVFQVSDKTRLERFLILGSDGATYYQKGPDLLEGNLTFIVDLIKRDEALVRNTVREISLSGRAYKNSPALFVTALLFKHGTDKSLLKELVFNVARTSTHLFELTQYFELLGGWNRSKRAAVAFWYTNRTTSKVAYQVVKYRQRNGWTHRDMIRLAHPKGIDKAVGSFILGKPEGDFLSSTPAIIRGFKQLQETKTAKDAVAVLEEFRELPWETLPTELHKSPEVWKKIFYNGQLHGEALLRNITRLARMKALDDLRFLADYVKALTDENMIASTRLHPIRFLNALIVHTEGQVNRRQTDYYGYGGGRTKDWTTVPQIVDALNDGFYLAFKHVTPSDKRFFLGVDVSGSMSGSIGQGLDISAAQAAAAMAMSIARTEPAYMVRGFTSNSGGWSNRDTELTDLGITPKMLLPEVFNRVQKSNFGATDCALPMLYATKNKLEIDTFVVLTDNETWHGDVHPKKALADYRKASGIDAKLIVVGMTATEFSIADPRDGGMLDVVGLDANLPKIVTEFSAGRI